jgi:acetoin utilization deacetylase AcuC-like enzyme
LRAAEGESERPTRHDDDFTGPAMTLLYHDRFFLEHDTGNHPENGRRLTAILERLEQNGLLSECRQMQCPPASAAAIRRVHDVQYVQRLQQWCAQGGGRIEVDTVVSEQSLEVALHAAGAVTDAVQRVLQEPARQALCLVRPPGHHALTDRAMGFCLLNHVAIAALEAIHELDVQRVMIVDWDVHHGNGTQAIFWRDPRVGFLSIHRWPFYPGTGRADETGQGSGRGTTANIPLAFGTPRREYLERFAEEVDRMARSIRPELVLVSAGFDAHYRDPVGSLGLESEDFGQLTRIVLQAARQYADSRVVSVLEGGYDPAALAESVEVHLRALMAEQHSDGN